MAELPVFLYDIGSPYSWLAAERISRVIEEADWQPILLGGLFKLNGRTSWGFAPDRETRRLEIEQRVTRYGLPAICWRADPPTAWLTAMRAATVARRVGRAAEFSLAAFRAAHTEGRDLGDPEEVAALACHAGMAADELLQAVTRQDVKDELRMATERAHELGAPGVPTVVVGDHVFWGDDRLEDAARAARAA
jgi:2-hydroxychromene-2-carboxylate isomerase